jgi:outer membrane protein TolC
MDDYLGTVIERHPFFVKESMQPDIERLGRDRLLGNEDWILRSSPFLSYEQPIQTSTFAAKEVWAAGLNGSVERAFWDSGGRLSLNWQWDFIDQDIPGISFPGPGGTPIEVPLGPSTFYQNKLWVTYSLPLLQNRGGTLDRLGYELADFDVDFAEIQALENQENFLLDLAGRFIAWEFEYEQARIANDRLTFQEEQLDQTRRKRRANLVDEVDVLRGEDAVQAARQNLVSVQSRLKAQQEELAVLARDADVRTASPVIDLYTEEDLPAIDGVVDEIGHQRIVRSLRTRVDQLRKQRHGLDDVTLPQLSLNLSGGLQEGDDGFIDAWGVTEPDVAVSLDFRYPLGNSTAETDVDRTSLEIRQLEKQIESVSLDLEAQMRSVWIQMEELKEILALNRTQIETSRKKTREEQRLYNQGRGELTFVIQSRDSEALAELTYAVNAAAYRRLVMVYRALVDRLLPDQ